MSKLNSESNKNNTLNLRIKSQTDEKKLRKIRKTLLSLIVMEIEASKSYNVTVIKKDQNEIKMVEPIALLQKNDDEVLEDINLNDVNNVNENNLDLTEQVNSSDFEDCDEEF